MNPDSRRDYRKSLVERGEIRDALKDAEEQIDEMSRHLGWRWHGGWYVRNHGPTVGDVRALRA